MGTQLEHEDMLREADALTRLLDERENLKELLDYTYHASDCQRMRERAFPERCICGLDELRRVHARMSYQKSERGRIAHNKATRSYGENHPARRAAHIAVGNAIRDGVLSRQPCEICGRLAQAHHDDYSKPLIVRWLCARHHAAWHKHNIPKYPEDESEKRSTS